MDELTTQDFITDEYDTYGKSMYKQYLKLSNDQRTKIIDLKSKTGETVNFLYRNKIRPMKIMAVCLFKGDVTSYPLLDADGNFEYDSTCKLFERSFRGYPFQFRLNYIDESKFRSYDGFWTNKIDNIQYK